MTRRMHRKKIMSVDEVTDREKLNIRVVESTFTQAGSRSDKGVKTTDSSSSILLAPRRKFKLTSQC